MEGSQPRKDGDFRIHQPSFGTTSTRHHYGHREDSSNVDGSRSLANLTIIGGSAHRPLAESIAHEVKMPLCKATLSRFADGEVLVQIMDNVRGQDVFIIQPCAAPVNDSIMELLLTVSCARRSGARRVTAVIPYFGYKHHRRGNAISTKHNSRFLWSGAGDFALMLEELGADHIIAVDLQRPGQGSEACFFDNQVPVETIVTTDLFIDNLLNKQKLSGPLTVVAPNAECYKKAKKFQGELQKRLKTPVKLLPFFSMDTGSGPPDLNELVVLDDSLVSMVKMYQCFTHASLMSIFFFLSQRSLNCGGT
jgi:ribose-phosphate pyrophosphokinase